MDPNQLPQWGKKLRYVSEVQLYNLKKEEWKRNILAVAFALGVLLTIIGLLYITPFGVYMMGSNL